MLRPQPLPMQARCMLPCQPMPGIVHLARIIMIHLISLRVAEMLSQIKHFSYIWSEQLCMWCLS